MSDDPLQEWAAALAAWAIPDRILSRASESPWQLPTAVFARRADARLADPTGVSLRRAAEALEPDGTVLDVGAGAGAASLPLAARAGHLVAVDSNPAMLEELRRRARELDLQVTTIEGEWPAVAHRTPPADVAVCSHVLYNVPQLAPFARTLTDHSRRRVVVEMTAHHPASGLNPLWLRFHGLVRPERPTWEDALRVLQHIGLALQVERWRRPAEPMPVQNLAELVALTRRRLCLPSELEPEVLAALVQLGLDPDDPRTWSRSDPELVTLWWEP